MRRATALGVATLIALALTGPAGRAAATIDIEVRNFEMVPRGVAAVAGDTLRWYFSSQHHLEAYEGDTFDTGIGTPGSYVERPFVGGTVKYRCTIPGHSTLTSGVCDGMCGVISATAPSVPKPAITTPADGAVLSTPGTTIGGSATAPAEIVRVFDNGGRLFDVEVTGGTFSRGVDLSNGTHVLTAVAIHADGYESVVSDAVTITIEATDTQPPTVELSRPDGPVTLRPVDVIGVARDDTVVSSVVVTVTNLATGEVTVPPVTCSTCGTAVASFSARAPVLPGVYGIEVRATDATGNAGTLQRIVVAV